MSSGVSLLGKEKESEDRQLMLTAAGGACGIKCYIRSLPGLLVTLVP